MLVLDIKGKGMKKNFAKLILSVGIFSQNALSMIPAVQPQMPQAQQEGFIIGANLHPNNDEDNVPEIVIFVAPIVADIAQQQD